MDCNCTFLDFVSSKENVLKYLHNTLDKETALNIINQGFRFENRLDYTTDLVSGSDIVQLDYFRLIRKKYGDYTMVMHIGKKLIEKYNLFLKNTNHYFYEVISDIQPQLSSDGEPIYVLNKQFIKGYYCFSKNEYYLNPKFNPENDIEEFTINLNNLTKKNS